MIQTFNPPNMSDFQKRALIVGAFLSPCAARIRFHR